MPESYTDKLLASVDVAAEKAGASIAAEWMKAKDVTIREECHAEMRALTKVVTKLKRNIRESK